MAGPRTACARWRSPRKEPTPTGGRANRPASRRTAGGDPPNEPDHQNPCCPSRTAVGRCAVCQRMLPRPWAKSGQVALDQFSSSVSTSDSASDSTAGNAGRQLDNRGNGQGRRGPICPAGQTRSRPATQAEYCKRNRVHSRWHCPPRTADAQPTADLKTPSGDLDRAGQLQPRCRWRTGRRAAGQRLPGAGPMASRTLPQVDNEGARLPSGRVNDYRNLICLTQEREREPKQRGTEPMREPTGLLVPCFPATQPGRSAPPAWPRWAALATVSIAVAGCGGAPAPGRRPALPRHSARPPGVRAGIAPGAAAVEPRAVLRGRRGSRQGNHHAAPNGAGQRQPRRCHVSPTPPEGVGEAGYDRPRPTSSPDVPADRGRPWDRPPAGGW